MKIIALALLLAAAPALAQRGTLEGRDLGAVPLAFGTTQAVYSEQLVIRQTANQSYQLLQWQDAQAEPVFWVTAEGCAWDRTDSAKPARLLGCAAKPDVIRKIRDENTFNRPVVVPENERLVNLLNSVPAQHADNPPRKEIR